MYIYNNYTMILIIWGKKGKFFHSFKNFSSKKSLIFSEQNAEENIPYKIRFTEGGRGEMFFLKYTPFKMVLKVCIFTMPPLILWSCVAQFSLHLVQNVKWLETELTKSGNLSNKTRIKQGV